MEYFDSRGVRRTYGASFEDGVLRFWRDDARASSSASPPRPDAAGFVGPVADGQDAGRLAGRPEGRLPAVEFAFMDLPEHWQPSSDRRILTWLGAFAALTTVAVVVRRARPSETRRCG